MGTARSETELAVLVAEAQRRLRPGQEALDLGLEDAPAGLRSGVITGKRSALLWQVVAHAYARLGFDDVEGAAFAQLVLARVVEPTSKRTRCGCWTTWGSRTRRCGRCSGR